jgi:Cytochrome C oxidase, cbb3-type, subunit III
MKRSAIISAWLVLTSCQKPAPDLREWQPTDHHNTTNDSVQAQQSDGKSSNAPPGLDDVTLATWSAKCVTCHGRVGKGDGPQAAMFRPRDLTDPAWQMSVSDARIAEVIQKGFGKMPGFALPEPTLGNLVRLVRMLNSDPKARAASQPATTGAAQPPNAAPSNAKAAEHGAGVPKPSNAH